MALFGGAALLTCSCGGDGSESIIWATGVTMSETSVSMLRGTSRTLSASVTPSDADITSVVWSSFDPAVATVEDGTVNAVAPGVTYIVAASGDGKAKSSCMVTVYLPDRYWLSAALPGGSPLGTELWSWPGSSVSLAVSSSDGEAHTYTWTSSDSSVSVSGDGTVSFGYAESSSDGYFYYGESDVKVSTEDTYSLSFRAVSNILAGLSLNGAYKSFGSAVSLSASAAYSTSALYSDGSAAQGLPVGSYTIQSSDSTVAAVSAGIDSYRLETGSSGTAVITVTFASGRSVEALTVSISDSVDGGIEDLVDENR